MVKKMFLIFFVMAGVMSLLSNPCLAEYKASLFGKPLSAMGYLQQTVSYNINSGDHFDTKTDFHSFLFQGLLEVLYEPSYDVRIFASGKLNADWAYNVYDSNDEWVNKGFDKAKDRLNILDDGVDLLSELHVTWTPGNYYFRIGKQIVVWGETDAFRLMDQINPQDTRRGMGDVQFESTILPLWLVTAEYNTPGASEWLQELGFQVVFNPNVQFRGNERFEPGNDRWGVWAANVKAPDPLGFPAPYPFDYAHIGSWADNLDKPDDTFESEGMEIGLRVRAVINDAIVTLNGFYGKDNDIVRRIIGPPDVEMSPFDNRLILHLPTDAHYPTLRFVGATFARDFPSLSSSALGGVAPTFRAEAMYVSSFTTVSSIQTFEKSDEIRWMVGMDWKVKVNWLNPKAYFLVSPQFYHRRILDYAEGVPGLTYDLSDYAGPLQKNNYTASLHIETSYLHTKLKPMIFWWQDITNNASLVKAQIAWEPSHKWKYTLGVLSLDGNKTGYGFEPLKHKDEAFFTIAYRF